MSENIDVRIRLIDEATKNLKSVQTKILSSTERIEKTTIMATQNMSRGWGNVGISIKAASAVYLASRLIDFTQMAKRKIDQLADAASDLNETVAKSGEIFGSSVKELEKWAEGAKAFGQSKTQALDAAATFGIFGDKAGLAGGELAKFSTDFAELASDMASFNNTSPEDAIIAIGAALRGESEPIRRYGVLLDDATLRQKALEIGITDTTKRALTPQQRVLAATKVIFEQTSKQQGDFARTSDGLANRQRILNAELENGRAQIGEGLLPLMIEWNELMLRMTRSSVPKLVTGISSLVKIFDHIRGKTPYQVAQFKDMVDVWKDSRVGADMLKNKLAELNEKYTEQRVELSMLSKFSGRRGPLNQEMTITKGMIDVATAALKEYNEEAKKATEPTPKPKSIITRTEPKKKKEKEIDWRDIGPSRSDYEEQIIANNDARQQMYEDTKTWGEEAARLHWEAHQRELSELEQLRERENAILENRATNYMYFGQAIGAAMAQGIAGGEGALKDAFKNTLSITLSFLERQVIAATVGNQLKNFMTLGPAGLLKAAGEAALITGIFETAKAGIQAFRDGGIVDYGTRTGDTTIARVNKNEMILNEQQQANLFHAANVKQKESAPMTVNLYDSSGSLIETIITKVRNGDRGVNTLVDELRRRI